MFHKRLLPGNVFCVDVAYFRGSWVFVPMFYVPAEAVDDDGCLHWFQFVPLDGKNISKPLPRRSIEEASRYIEENTKKTILPWMLSKKGLKDLCANNNIPLGWVTNQFPRNISKNKTNGRSSRRKKRKYSPLNEKDYIRFMRKLRKISKQSAVIAEILWFLNDRLSAGDDYITLEEVLRMQLQDVDPEDGVTTCIRLLRDSPQGSHMVVHYLPEYIWTPLCQVIKNDSLFVFSSKNRGPLLPSDIVRHFKQAGKLAGIKGSVCSLSLRPIGKCCLPKDNAVEATESYDEAQLQEISAKEWKRLRDQIPSLIGKRGRSAKHNPRMIFNAILYHFRTRTPYRNLPHIYPPAKAVHSQYRRWREKGVLDAVLKARE